MRFLCLLVILCLAIVGCGGDGGDGPVAVETPVRFTVFWDQQNRTINAPSSAMSATVHIEGSGNSSTDFTFNRPENPDAVLQEVVTSGKVNTGNASFEIVFYAQPNGEGDAVAAAAGTANIAADGRGIGNVTTVQLISRVAVAPGQTMMEGEAQTLVATAFDPEGDIVAVRPDTIFWSVASGDGITFSDGGVATGTRRGVTSVVATIDRVASQPVEVFVSFEARVIPIMPVGGTGITFVNDMTPDGMVAVGTTRNETTIQGFRWTEAGGTEGLPLPPGMDAASAFAVSDDGNTIAGGGELIGENTATPWMWTAAGGSVLLEVPEGFETATVSGISGDGTIIVGSAQTGTGESSAVLWRNGGSPETFFDGQATGITRDGTQIIGYMKMDDDRQVAWKWSGAGYFTTFTTPNPTTYLTSAMAVSNDGSVVGGAVALEEGNAPGFWTPGTSVVQINGGLTTSVYSMSGDGELMGGGAPESGIAFYWTPTSGLQNFGRFLAEKGLIDEFGDTGPGTVNAISDDKTRFAVTGYPGGGAEAPPRGFIVELPDFMDR